MDAKSMVDGLYQAHLRELRPQPMHVYRPNRKDLARGAALKLNLRLVPEYGVAESGSRYLAAVQGGLFLDLAPQVSFDNGRGDPEFGWRDGALLTMKLGRRDVLALRYAIAQFRAEQTMHGFEAPAVLEALQPRDQPGREPLDPERKRRIVNLFHKNEQSSTVLRYEFEPQRAVLTLSTPGLRRSIVLDPLEELDFQTYLAYAHERLLELGVR